MRIFRRRASGAEAQAEAIAAFWGWWQGEGASEVAAAIAGGRAESVVPSLSPRIKDIHDGLAWELAPGRLSEHLLVVSPEGDPELRAVARRWLRAAPPADATWTYADARQPVDDPSQVVLEAGGTSIDIARATAGARVSGASIDVTVHHPAYPQLAERERAMATFLMLDAVLGEADVETWLGSIASSEHPSLDPVPLIGLRATVRDLRDRFTDEDGQPAWALLNGTTPDGGPVLASVRIPLRPLLAPDHDTHVAIAVPYTAQTDAGLPDEGALRALRQLEEHVSQRLGQSGGVVAHQTAAGTRMLHLYVDGTTPAAEQVRAAVTGWEQGTVRVDVAKDPAWERVAHLRP